MQPDETPPKPARKGRGRKKEQDAPLTKEGLAEEIQLLTERAKAAGLSPIQTLARTYIKQGRAILAGVLDALDNEQSSKKKR